MKINIGSRVRLRLNSSGKHIAREAGWHVEQDRDGWSEWSLLHAMKLFGGHFYGGQTYLERPFRPEIEIVEDPIQAERPPTATEYGAVNLDPQTLIEIGGPMVEALLRPIRVRLDEIEANVAVLRDVAKGKTMGFR